MSKPEPKPILSDRQLTIATWLYRNRPFLKQALVLILGLLAGVIFIIFLINGLIYLLIQPGHRLRVLKITQNEILAQDLALQFSPRPLQVKAINMIKHGGQGVDFLAEVVNPNSNWQAFSFGYEFVTADQTLPAKTSFALPGTKYLAGFSSQSITGSAVDLRVSNLQWRKIISTIDKERLSLLKFVVPQTQFVPGDKKQIVDSVKTTIKNSSPFGFWQVDVMAVLYKNQKIIAVGEGQIANFASGQSQEVEIGVGILKVDQVDRIEIIPQVNILNQASIR